MCCWFVHPLLFYSFKYRHSVTQCFYSTVQCNCVGGDTPRILVANICFSIHQMSKSTGNFLTLSQAIEKFSADGTLCFFLIYLPSVFLIFHSSPLSWFSLNNSVMFHWRMKKALGKHFEQIAVCLRSAQAIRLHCMIKILYLLAKIIRKCSIPISDLSHYWHCVLLTCIVFVRYLEQYIMTVFIVLLYVIYALITT